MTLSQTLLKPVYRLYEDRLRRALVRDGLPRHVGVIHDGHRRYARQAGLADYRASYETGMSKVEDLLGWCRDLEIENVTCWLLSQENLQRPAAELDPYYDVLVDLFDRLPDVLGTCGYDVGVIGTTEMLPARVRDAVDRMCSSSSGGERRVTIAVAYGGRQEIVDAVKDLVGKLAAEGLEADAIAEKISADGLAEHLYTADLPDPDLVIRTSGESRLSGFLLWQAAYAEYVFVDVYWPQFRRVDFYRALREYSLRERRFGK